MAPLLTVESGQYRSFFGGLQPLVMPASASRLMSSSKIEPSSSTKWSFVAGGRFSALLRKAAICPRRTPSEAQKRSLSGGLHPRVMLTAAIASMFPS